MLPWLRLRLASTARRLELEMCGFRGSPRLQRQLDSTESVRQLAEKHIMFN
jgi:hypothetical protein